MRYYVDEHDEVWSEEALEKEYDKLIEDRIIDKETYPNFGCYLDDCLHNACTLTSVKLSSYDETKRNDEELKFQLKIAYLDPTELPYVLNAMIKQELYRWNFKSTADEITFKEHIEAELTSTGNKKITLKSMLKAFQLYSDVNVNLNNAADDSAHCDLWNAKDINDLYSESESKMCELGTLMVQVIKEILPPNVDMSEVYSEWFEGCGNDNYIDALIRWCDTDIVLEAYDMD